MHTHRCIEYFAYMHHTKPHHAYDTTHTYTHIHIHTNARTVHVWYVACYAPIEMFNLLITRVPSTPDPSGVTVILDRAELERIEVQYPTLYTSPAYIHVYSVQYQGCTSLWYVHIALGFVHLVIQQQVLTLVIDNFAVYCVIFDAPM